MNKTDLMRFGAPYVGVFRSARPNCSESLRKASTDFSALIVIYEAVGTSIGLVVGGTHTESAASILDAWHQTAEGGSFVGPILSKLQRPPAADVWIARHRVADVPGPVLRVIGETATLFALLDIASDSLMLVSEDKSLLFWDPTHEAASAPRLFALSWAANPTDDKTPTRPRRTYDPLRSQITELTAQTLPALEERVRHLSKVWAQTFPSAKPDQFRELELNVKVLRETMRDATKDEASLDVSVVDMFAARAESDIRACTDLAARIAEFTPTDPWTTATSYISGGSSLTLKAASGYARSLLQRVGLAEVYCPIPFFGERYTLYSHYLRDILPCIVPIEIPRSHRFRLGAFPILAHEVAHLRVHSPGGDHLITSLIVGTYGQDLARMLEIGAPGTADLHGPGDTHRRVSCAGELAADLIACTIAGPAYVYAMTRFASGTLSEFTERGVRPHPDFLPFAERVNACISYMRFVGFDIRFDAKLWRPREIAMTAQLVSELGKFVDKPYAASEHAQALAEVQPALLEGRIVRADSGRVINALWDAVVRQAGYANEFAAMYAVALEAL